MGASCSPSQTEVFLPVKRNFAALLIGASILTAGPFAKADLSVAAIVEKHSLSITEAAAALLIADALDLDVTAVIRTGAQAGQSLVTLGPAFVIARDTKMGVLDVWRKGKGRGWGVIAQELGWHPGTFNKMRVQGDLDRVIWVNLATSRFKHPPSVWEKLEKDGFKRPDIITAFVLSGGDKKKLDTIVGEFKKSKKWKIDAPKGKGSGKPGKGGGPGKGG